MQRRFLIICLTGLIPLSAAYARDLNIITYNTTVIPLWQFVSSVPGDNELLNAPPQSVAIAFSQNIDPGKSSFSVYDPYNNPLGNINVTIKDFSMTAPLPLLPTGTYRVEWKAGCLCRDGSALNGVLHFTVQ